jgi:ABC-type branched-subunit amino acid transport system ATPase component
VSLEAHFGRVVGLIGPNGSGKTTFLNTVCGYVRPDTGTVRLFDHDMTGWKAAKRARHGLARTFQTSLLFDELSCVENVLVAVDSSHAVRRAAYILRLPAARRRERESFETASRILASFGLADRMHDAAGDLPPGERRLLELARVVAVAPRLVLMDEPAAGLNEAECDRLAEIIAILRSKGMAVIVVEHHVKLIRDVCDTVVVLDAGTLIASGLPEDVLRDPVVVASYLGEMGPEQDFDREPHNDRARGIGPDEGKPQAARLAGGLKTDPPL